MGLPKAKNIDAKYYIDQLDNEEKVAILMSTLGPEIAKQIFQRLKDVDVFKILEAMESVNQVPIEVVRKILEEYYRKLSEETDYVFVQSQADELIAELIDNKRREKIFGKDLKGGVVKKTLDSLEMVDDTDIGQFLQQEHPQTIAIVLSHLPLERRKNVFKMMSEKIQADLLIRLGHIDSVSPQVVQQLDEILGQELVKRSKGRKKLGGTKEVALMLNKLSGKEDKGLMEQLEQKDPELAQQIRKQKVEFEDLANLNGQEVQYLLNSVDSNTLLLALKLSSDELKHTLFSHMSSRAAKIIQEDLDALGPKRSSEVKRAQNEIINICRRLEAEGKLVLNKSGADDTFV